MADTPYTYSVQTDFPNHKVDSGRLREEILGSAIVTALRDIITEGDVCTITFKATLSAGDELILDGIVAVHSGEPLEPHLEVQPVKLVESNLLDPDIALSKTKTHYVTIKASQLVTEQDITYPYPIDAGAARYFIPADEARVKNDDRFDVIGIPGGDPFVGFVTANVAQGETVIPVSSTVFEYLRHGLNLKFASHAKDYEIMAEDTVAGTLTLKEGLEQAISVGDLIHIRRVMFEDMTPNKGGVMSLGDLSTGSSGLCANAKLRIRYRCAVEPTEDFVLGFELIHSY
jgi:hypothetical protein